MPHICILTPDPADADSVASRWPDVLSGYAELLGAAGLGMEARPWVEEGLGNFDLLLPLLAWGYHKAGALWADRLYRLEGEGVRIANPPSVLRWNADKRYLSRIADSGAPVVPTVFVERLSEATMAEAAASFGVSRLVAKPRVSASAWRTIRWAPGDGVEDGPENDALIQPYLPSIESEGEVSLIYFAGRYSHAIRKVPRPGDFRVQPEYQGAICAHRPAADERAAADAILAAVDEDLLYARIDLVRDCGGRPALIELELIEPDLYLGYDAASGANFTAAIVSAHSG
jgi:glutathione synthase/RimK-type ligase-like ATP-grasp enzyme